MIASVDEGQTCRRPATVMTPAERKEYVAWWLYESGLEVDELIEIATMLVDDELSTELSTPLA